MIPLIKIRSTYLKRNKFQIIFSYILIPLIEIISAIVYMVKKGTNKAVEMNPKQIFKYPYDQDYYLFKDSNFQNISLYLSNTSLVVNDNDIGKKLVQYIKEEVNLDLKLYSKESHLNNYSQNIVILFHDNKKKTYKFTYKENEIKNSNTNENFPFLSSHLNTKIASDLFKYEYDTFYNFTHAHNKKFLIYQAFFAKFLIEKINGYNINKDIHFNFGLNSYPKSVKNPRNYYNIELLLSCLITLQFTFVFLSLSAQMLEEKEKNLEKFLERQGINHIKYLLSWFITFIIVSLLTNIAIVIGGFALLQTFFGIYILDLILFNLGSFTLLMFLVGISRNKKYGLLLVNICQFGSLALGYVLTLGSPNRVIHIIFNLFPNVNLFCSIKLIIKLQFLGKYSSDRIRLNYNGINFLDTSIIFIIEIILFILVSLFIKKYQNSGLDFINFIKSIFIKVVKKNNIISPEENNKEINHEELNDMEQYLKNQNLYLNIKNVTKKYDGLFAVNNFNCELFKNEIFCLLGHNGAGKTTLIKMISGVEDPDSGDIFLNNISIITNKNYLFRNIGLCQQEDIFFDYLTVNEHLKYMLEIKSIKSDLDQINNLVRKIGLMEKQDAICKTLSGGEKRKLCVALALIGNPELVLLDEPTSGMDIISKKSFWDFLKEFKKNKIIILTTHSLDEAEYLGDKIGIMKNGQYICSGSSSFLKSKYPCGFNLNLLIDSNICNDDVKQKLYKELIQYEPTLEIKINSKSIFSINIQSNNKKIKDIFNVIMSHKEEYGIEDYTISSTSLEDVFLKLNNNIKINEEEKNDNENVIVIEGNNIFNFNTFFSQLKSHIKRLYFSLWRNKIFSFLELLLGLFVLYIYVIIYHTILGQQYKNNLNLTELLENNNIYVCKNSKNFLKESYVNEDLCSVKLKDVDNTNSKNEFIENIYQNSLGNIGKSGICINNIDTKNEDYEVINSEIPLSIPSYIMANSMLIVSTYLKKEYNIKAAIFDEIINIKRNEIDDIDYTQISIMFSICYACTLSLCIYLSTIVSEKIKERIKNIKQLLYLSGTNMFTYWFGFHVVDSSKMVIFSSLAAAGIYLINDYAFYIWINLIIIIFSSLSFVYSISFFFEKEESAQKTLNFLVFIFLIILGLIIFIKMSIDNEVNLSFLFNRYNYTILDIYPITSFMLSSFRIIFSYYFFKIMYIPEELQKFDFYNFGSLYRPKYYILTSLIVHIINFIFFTGLLILLEFGYVKRFFNFIKVKYFIKESNTTFSNIEISEEFLLNNNYFEDGNNLILKNNRNTDDNHQLNNNKKNKYIEKEISKINNDYNNKLTTKIVSLKKTYWICCKKNIRVINDLYLGLENSEKFGLLGFNGSGKTTLFKSITKEILYDNGSISLFGKNIKTEFNEICQFIGYCPQENPLFDYMKVSEMIKFYLTLRNRNESVYYICKNFGLENYLDTYCINLSGGNKRKLSFAIALMCEPKILLLDEPSTGVDPESRRLMWKNIIEKSKKVDKFNMILSTHSMEEAEILCDTVSWLKSGNFISIGNPEKLKIEITAGYKLHIKYIKIFHDSNQIKQSKGIDLNKYKINGIDNFTELINNNKELQVYVKELEKVIDLIRDKCTEIVLTKINKDLSFEFKIYIVKEKQNELFIQILDMKNSNILLSEINISMESLENILTKL